MVNILGGAKEMAQILIAHKFWSRSFSLAKLHTSQLHHVFSCYISFKLNPEKNIKMPNVLKKECLKIQYRAYYCSKCSMCPSTDLQTSSEYILQEPWMVQWFRVETRDRAIWVCFPALAVISIFGCGLPFILARSFHTPHAVLRSPSASSQRVADFGELGYRARLEYHVCQHVL